MTQDLSTPRRNARVLLVEDNADHAFLARDFFEESGLPVDLHHVDRGDRCMAYLRRQAPYEDALRPDLILLDIHMPRMDGFEVMQAIVADQALRSLPVLVLSTSSEPKDVERMHALGCHGYLTKPLDMQPFTNAIEKLAADGFDLGILSSPSV